MLNKIDHIAIGCSSLEAGNAFLQDRFGLTVPAGSKHTAMSTHNCVMQAGNESFFELIAVDPEAPAPGRARWFSLDDPATRARLDERPRALAWVVNTSDLDAIVANAPVDLGEVVDFARGDRTWRLTVPKDGSMPEGGLIPTFIEWSPGPHPSLGQQDLGFRLNAVSISHPDPEAFGAWLKALRIDHLASISEGAPGLAFELAGPDGTIVLD